MKKKDKIKETQIQLYAKEHYRPLAEPMVNETYRKVLNLIDELYVKEPT